VSSTNHRPTIEKIISENGWDGITHIIEYNNMFDGATTWKLCTGKKMFDYAMSEGAFIDPKLIWEKK
jgi:hypothetical protein